MYVTPRRKRAWSYEAQTASFTLGHSPILHCCFSIVVVHPLPGGAAAARAPPLTLQFTVALNYIHPYEKNAAGVHMSTNTVISNQNERKKLPLEKQTYMLYTLWTHKKTYTETYTFIQTHIRLSILLHTKKLRYVLSYTALINYV